MAHFHIKKKRGRPYLYVREIARVNGKPKVISQVYIGSPERVRKLVCGQGEEELRLKVEEWGSLFLAQLADEDIDLVEIVDSVIVQKKRETGPTVGEYFLYCVWNRMIQSVSKRALADWYKHTAIQQIRPVDLSELTSQRYWDKWDIVSADDLRQIGQKFFEKICEIDRPTADCLLFDTTNYFTYLSTDTKSSLAKRGHSKDGKPQLRQVGLALLVDRGSRIPLFYREYPGNMHDSRLFGTLMDEMFGVIYNLKQTNDCLTVVIDKGMNSEDNIIWIDEHAHVHFVTSYSPYFAEELVAIPLERFEPVDTVENLRLEKENKSNERLLAHRTTGKFWGKERTVVITYNPATARKQEYNLESKMEQVRQGLQEMRSKARGKTAHWRHPEKITDRYIRLCERLHIPSNLYNLEFTQDKNSLLISFRKDIYRIKRKQARFGKNIIVTDRSDWSTTAIVQAHLDRWQVEERFRQSKDDDLVTMRPVRHWTDSKIRCHLFSCVVALTYLRRLERKLSAAGISRTATDVIAEMRRLHSVLSFRYGARTPSRRIETPSKTQSKVLSALGYAVDNKGVLQILKG